MFCVSLDTDTNTWKRPTIHESGGVIKTHDKVATMYFKDRNILIVTKKKSVS